MSIIYTRFKLYILLYSMDEESIGIVKIFDFQFLIDILVLECLGQDYTIFTKFQSLSVCMTQSLWLASPKTNGHNYIKFYI